MLEKTLKYLRKENGITQEELAKAIGVTTSMVGMYETGARKPSYEVLFKISEYFDVSIDYLLGRDKNNNCSDTINSKFKPIIDSLDRAGDLKDEEIDDIREQVEFLINFKRQKRKNS